MTDENNNITEITSETDTTSKYDESFKDYIEEVYDLMDFDNFNKLTEEENKGKNLFEVNGIKYTYNFPDDMRVSLTKEQYVEYLQQKELIEKLQKENEELNNRDTSRLSGGTYYRLVDGKNCSDKENYISKDIIREKYEIEEALSHGEIAYGVIKYREGKAQALKELLEEEQ